MSGGSRIAKLAAAGRGRSLVAVLAMCSCLSWHCQGNVAENTPVDASSGTDGAATMGDGSNDGPNMDGAGHASADAYSGICMISAASYDQSCIVDTDCQEVTSTNYCAASCLCGGSAINIGAASQFNADISETPLGSGALGPVGCPCAQTPGPCCRSGTCTTTCFSASDTLPSCADAGGTCLVSRPGSVTCTNDGPPDACAYSDEVCCVQ
jgi:hypothetical protein